MSEVFEIWIYFLLYGLVLGMTLKGLGKLFVIFTADIWLWFSVATTYMLRAIFFSLDWLVQGMRLKWLGKFFVTFINLGSIRYIQILEGGPNHYFLAGT